MRFATFFTLMLGLTLLGACSEEYTALPVSARVVDADTGQPLAGVHVVADWQLVGGLEGGNTLGPVKVMETQTDAEGRFLLPGWGPQRVSIPAGVYANARIRSRAPGLILFRSGYEPLQLQNEKDHVPSTRSIKSEWDGRTIQLRRSPPTASQRIRSLEAISGSMLRYIAMPRCESGQPCPSKCQWQNTPNAIRAIGQEFRALEATDGVRRDNIYTFLILNEDTYRREGCASARTVLGGETK